MKKICVLLIACLAGSLYSQNLVEIYKTGKVKLVPESSFATDNDWESVFESYEDQMGGKQIGARKSMIFTPDGSIVVSHAYRDFYSMFDPKGNFVREFGVIGKDGKKETSIKPVMDIIGENTFIAGADNMGNMRCFDLQGRMVKKLKVNYSLRDLVVLNDHQIAVAGWVIWKEKFRNFVAILDYRTNEEKIIWDHFTNRSPSEQKPGLFNYVVRFENGGLMSYNTMPYTISTGNMFSPKLNVVDQYLFVSVPATGEIIKFDFNGEKRMTQKMSWDPDQISVEEQKEIQQNYINIMKQKGDSRFRALNVSDEESKKIIDKLLQEMEADLHKISEPINKPYFSTILKDSDDNLLFFTFPEEKGANAFHVWVVNNGGEFVCQSSFECEDYELSISPGKMVFKDGYIFGLQIKDEVEGIPLRLVKFHLEPGS